MAWKKDCASTGVRKPGRMGRCIDHRYMTKDVESDIKNKTALTKFVSIFLSWLFRQNHPDVLIEYKIIPNVKFQTNKLNSFNKVCGTLFIFVNFFSWFILNQHHVC